MDNRTEMAARPCSDTPVTAKIGVSTLLPAGELMSGDGERAPAYYEKPRLVVIGDVRDLTTGNSSSGNQDANSQYYW